MRDQLWKSLPFRQILAVSAFALVLAGCSGGSQESVDADDNTASAEKTDNTASAEETQDDSGGTAATVRIGVVTPLSGSASAIGADTRRSVDLAVDEINESGGIEALDGAQIEVVLVDSEGDPQISSTAVERLVSSEDVDMIVGVDISASTAAGVQQAERLQTLYLNASSTDATLLERCYKYYLTEQIIGQDNAAAAVGLIDYLRDEMGVSVDSVAILNEDSAKGEGDADAFESQAVDAGLDVVSRTSYNVEATDLIPVMSRARQSDPDVVLWSGYVADQALGIQAMESLDWLPYVVGAGSGLSDPEILELLGPELLDAVHASSTNYYSSLLPSERAQEFGAAYEERYDQPASPYSSLGYQGLYTAVALINHAGSVDNETILDAVPDFSLPGEETVTPFPEISFDECGRNLGAQPMISQWQGGEEQIVWPERVQTAEPSTPDGAQD